MGCQPYSGWSCGAPFGDQQLPWSRWNGEERERLAEPIGSWLMYLGLPDVGFLLSVLLFNIHVVQEAKLAQATDATCRTLAGSSLLPMDDVQDFEDAERGFRGPRDSALFGLLTARPSGRGPGRALPRDGPPEPLAEGRLLTKTVSRLRRESTSFVGTIFRS